MISNNKVWLEIAVLSQGISNDKPKPKTEQEFREWIRTLIKEVKEENKREVTK
ncbi:hypothetical protein [uncultured phage MedDCM-OCT-S11-C149]|nr:hypothetical protein [uncultured phage MedDCM-OCT-S11-C149]